MCILHKWIVQLDGSDHCVACALHGTSNSQGMCLALWLDPAKVPDVAEDLMSDAGLTFPLLLSNRVRAQCCDRMGRRFNSILKRIPQVNLFSIHMPLCFSILRFNTKIVRSAQVLNPKVRCYNQPKEEIFSGLIRYFSFH